MKYLIALLALASCASNDLQPYEYEVEMIVTYQDGYVNHEHTIVNAFERPESYKDLLSISDGCLQQQYHLKKLSCGVTSFKVLNYTCVNCGK